MKVFLVTGDWWDDGCHECNSGSRHTTKVFGKRSDDEDYITEQKQKSFRITYDIDEMEVE